MNIGGFHDRIAWSLTLFILLWKPKRERAIGTMRDLLYICLMFVALKLDGLAPYSWNIVFLIPWMWFATLLLGALVVSNTPVAAYQKLPDNRAGVRRSMLCSLAACCAGCGMQTASVIIVAYACMDLRELSLPGGFLLLLLSAASQLPGFISLGRYLDGDVTVEFQVCAWGSVPGHQPGHFRMFIMQASYIDSCSILAKQFPVTGVLRSNNDSCTMAL
jgi:hypothetical protein